MPHRLRASVALVALVVLNVALLSSDTWADPPPGDEVTLDASSAIGQIIDNLGGPSAGPGLALTNLDTELPSNVRCEDEQTKSNPFCARLALAAARAALTDLWLKAKGTVTVKWTIAVAKAVGELFGGGEESTPEEELETKFAEDLDKAIEQMKPGTNTRTDTETLANCGKIQITWLLLAPATAGGNPRLQIRVAGDCQCKYTYRGQDHLGRLGKFAVTITGELKPDVPLSKWRALLRQAVAKKIGVDLPWTPTLSNIEYSVLAHCNTCENNTSEGRTPAASPSPEPSATPTPMTPQERVQRICEHICAKQRQAYEAAMKAREDACFTYLSTHQGKAECDAAIAKYAAAKAAYYECLKKCCEQAVALKEIPALPSWLEQYNPGPSPTPAVTPTPRPTATPINKDGAFKSVLPQPGNAPADEQSYVPPVAGPGSDIVATFVDPDQSGPSDVVVGIVTDDGKSTYYRGHTGSDHKIRFALPAEIGGAVVTTFLLAKGFDAAGHPDEDAGHGIVTSDGPVPDTETIANAPSGGPAIRSAATSYERTPGKGLVQLETSGTSPENTQFELDGKREGIVTRAVSDRSAVGELNSGVTLGRHTIDVNSDGVRSNTFQADVVELHPHPLPASFVGQTVPLVVEVRGLGSDPATMTFAVGGAATLDDGSSLKTVAVQDGVARVGVRGVRAGQVIVHFNLHVTLLAAPS